LWPQFLIDLMGLCPVPNPGGHSAYTTLTAAECKAVTTAFFMQLELPFNAVVCSQETAEEWRCHFDRLFPTDEEGVHNLRAQGNFRYLHMWQRLTRDLSPELFEIAKAAIWGLFDLLWWIPATSPHVVWNTE
ncbi:hypothetical protein L227DRAFT_468359, partial [Lentinus tigrinus ALCF2SS1-6]